MLPETPTYDDRTVVMVCGTLPEEPGGGFLGSDLSWEGPRYHYSTLEAARIGG